jgi:hypothetical protein
MHTGLPVYITNKQSINPEKMVVLMEYSKIGTPPKKVSDPWPSSLNATHCLNKRDTARRLALSLSCVYKVLVPFLIFRTLRESVRYVEWPSRDELK